ncbi:MAG: GNAT family N-acetyltransferase [Candidatus Hodarchaeales archaeon]|jgi:ribosomal protein S18 acetylase RimI-like enzyme
MRIHQIFPEDYPDNKIIQFQYESNYYYDIVKKEKENGTGWSFDLIKSPFKSKFVKNLKEAFFDKYKENTEYFVMLNDQDIEVGQLSVGHQKFNNRARIWDIYIDRAFQRQGMGTSLLRFAENKAKYWKCRLIVLEVQSSNFNAIKFYEKNGFSVSGFDLNFYNNNDIEKHEIRLEMSKNFEKLT